MNFPYQICNSIKDSSKFVDGFKAVSLQNLRTVGIALTAFLGIGGFVYAGCKLMGARFTAPSNKSSGSHQYTDAAYLRWMNIWLDIQKRDLTGSNKHILILGPGKWESENKVYSPQMAEACKLWNGSQFTVLDDNESVLDAARSIDHQLEESFISNTLKINDIRSEVFEKVFLVVKQKLISKQQPEYKLDAKKFKIGSDSLSEDFHADVILATFSLLYPLKEIAQEGHDEKGEERMKIVSHYISKLSPGGVMYIDKICLQTILGKSADFKKDARFQNVVTNSNIEGFKRTISNSVGFEVDLVHLPQVMGFPIKGGQYLLAQPSADGQMNISKTSDAYAIVRL